MGYKLLTGIELIDISDDFAKQILQSEKKLSKFLRIFAYKYIIQKNLEDLISFLRPYQENYNGLEFDSAECNRLLYNVLNTVYAFEQSFNKSYGNEIKQIKQYLHQHYFEYSILSALRDYMEHSDLGVSNVMLTLGKYGARAKAYINLKKIADDISRKDKFDGFKQKVEKLIADKEDVEIELLPLFEHFKDIFYIMQSKVWKMLSSTIIESFKCLGLMIKSSKMKTRDVFLYNDGRYISAPSNVYHTFYVMISKCFILPEHVMEKSDDEIREFYKTLSFDYYGEKDKYYPQKFS